MWDALGYPFQLHICPLKIITLYYYNITCVSWSGRHDNKLPISIVIVQKVKFQWNVIKTFIGRDLETFGLNPVCTTTLPIGFVQPQKQQVLKVI